MTRSYRMLTKVSGALVLTAAFVVAGAARAEGAFVAYICNDAACSAVGDVVGNADVIVTDNGLGDLSPVLAGRILFENVGVGGLTVVGSTSQSKPIVGSASSPEMDINFNATGTGTAWIYASDTGFTGGALSGQLDGNFSGASSVQGGIFGGYNDLNLALATGVLSGVLSTSPFSASWVGPVPTVATHSWTIMVKITRSTPGQTTGDLLVVPEPASLALLGLGLVGIGIASRRRRIK